MRELLIIAGVCLGLASPLVPAADDEGDNSSETVATEEQNGDGNSGQDQADSNDTKPKASAEEPDCD